MTGEQHIRRFTGQMAVLFAVLSITPFLFGLLAAPSGFSYLGFQTNTDDHMVYAAWMRQAMEGRVLFDNRFAVDAQPGLTLHLFFLALGWVAKGIGIPWACALARAGLTYLFVVLLGRLVRRLTDHVYTAKLAIALAMAGGGIGFLVWHNFGQELVKPSTRWLAPLTGGRLPVDVWQPEAFVMPSLLTNALFMASLCLVLAVFTSVLDAGHSWKAVGIGTVCLGLLMNIHSYDVLLVALVLVGFLVAAIVQRQANAAWIGRAALIALGALPFALWFLHVLKEDPVFQARAATPTYAPTFRQVVVGYALMIVPSVIGWFYRDAERRTKLAAGATALAVLIGYLLSVNHDGNGYWLSWPAWVVAFGVAVALAASLSTPNPSLNLVTCWALVGLVAPYFPALFQRKLAAGLSIPWAILAAFGVAAVIERRDRNARNLATVLAVVVLSATSIRWLARERELIQADVASTTVHPVYLNLDVQNILERLNAVSGRKVVIAMPGVPNGSEEPDLFGTPVLPDLNPIVSGLTGAYTYAGHWSETPDYGNRRTEALKLFLRQTTDEERKEVLRKSGANYIIAPVPEAFPRLQGGLVDVSSLGTVEYDGSQFRLIKL